jgi:hypothetical protein
MPAPHVELSFARRHPILTGFGLLAGVSLFASYFPLSAVVTAGLVAVKATGADAAAVRAGSRLFNAVVQRWRARSADPPQRDVPQPVPTAPEPASHAPQRDAATPSLERQRVQQQRAAMRARRELVKRERAKEERELAGM